MVDFLKEILKRHDLIPFRLSSELEVSHPTVGRWLSGEDKPNPSACQKLAKYTGIPLMKILALAGHIPDTPETPEDLLPEFRTYMNLKYPGDMGEELTRVLERMLNCRREARLKNRR